MFGAGDTTLRESVAGMQIGPVRGNLQPTSLGGDQGVFVRHRGGQGAGRIQLGEIISNTPSI